MDPIAAVTLTDLLTAENIWAAAIALIGGLGSIGAWAWMLAKAGARKATIIHAVSLAAAMARAAAERDPATNWIDRLADTLDALDRQLTALGQPPLSQAERLRVQSAAVMAAPLADRAGRPMADLRPARRQ